MESNNNNNEVKAEAVVATVAPEMSKQEYLASLAERGLGESVSSGMNFKPTEQPTKVEPKSEIQDAVDKSKEFDASLNVKEEPKQEEIEIKAEEIEPEIEKETSGNSIDLKAMYKIPVDGKVIELTGAELQARASAEVAVEKRFLEVDKAKKAWQNELQAQKAADMKRIQEGDLYGVLSEKFDIPVYALKEKLLNELSPAFVRRMNMTEEQIQAEKLLQERKYYKDSYENELNRRQEEQKAEAEKRIKAEEDALNQEILQIRESHKISNDEWSAAFSALDKSIPPDQDIDVNMVRDYVLNNLRSEKQVDVSSIASKVLAPYKSHVNKEFQQKLEDYIKMTPDLTEDEISKIVKASVQKGLKMQLTGDDSEGSQEMESKEEKLNRLKEEALAKALGNRDTSKNWF